MSTLEIHSVLFLSTAHIEKDTGELLDLETDDVPPCYEKGLFGWWVVVPDAPYGAKGDTQDPPTLPADLAQIFKLAREHNCTWVCLDRDGPEIESLPRYEW